MPGAVASWGKDHHPISVGRDAPGGQPLRTDSIFRIQSMTKPVAAVAMLRLVQDGLIGLEDPIAAWMPELAEPRVLSRPDAALSDSEPAQTPITVRHLLTNQSGFGVMTTDSPLKQAMVAAGVEAGAAPVALGAQDWLNALSALPLAFEPGRGWRYHHSFGLLGILLGRLGRGSTQRVLADTVFTPAGMADTGFSVPPAQAHRLIAAFRHRGEGFEESEPPGEGFYCAPPPFDVSHSELVSTLWDYHAFLRALLDGRLLSPEFRDELRSDQIPSGSKTAESFYPGFWESTGWGFGVSVVTGGPCRGRFGWSGGLGTDFFVDPDGRICIVMTQVEMNERVFGLLAELHALGPV